VMTLWTIVQFEQKVLIERKNRIEAAEKPID